MVGHDVCGSWSKLVDDRTLTNNNKIKTQLQPVRQRTVFPAMPAIPSAISPWISSIDCVTRTLSSHLRAKSGAYANTEHTVANERRTISRVLTNL